MPYENYGMSRQEALSLLRDHLANENLLMHCLASEAVLRALARHTGENEAKWGLAGLLHDLDAESHADLSLHTHETVRVLTEKGVDEEVVEAIRLHNLAAHPEEKRTTPLQILLAAGETLTGLIIATALVQPDRRLASVKVKSVTKRMKEKAFARGANRDIIRECEQAGIPLPEFCAIGLSAMQEISDSLGL